MLIHSCGLPRLEGSSPCPLSSRPNGHRQKPQGILILPQKLVPPDALACLFHIPPPANPPTRSKPTEAARREGTVFPHSDE